MSVNWKPIDIETCNPKWEGIINELRILGGDMLENDVDCMIYYRGMSIVMTSDIDYVKARERWARELHVEFIE